MMRRMRGRYLEVSPPLARSDTVTVILITNAAEEIFFLLTKLGEEFNPYSHEDKTLRWD